MLWTARIIPLSFRALLSVALCLFFFAISGCQSSTRHTLNPQLRQIDELINAEIPAGSTRAQVNLFLSSRGYELQPSNDHNAVIAIVSHIDTETLEPSAARVTFHFNPDGTLLSYEMQSATVPVLH